jgi:hypothetical protein
MLMEQEITSLRKLVEQEVDYKLKNFDGTRGGSRVQEW